MHLENNVTRALLLFQELDIGVVKYNDRWQRCLSTRALLVFLHPPSKQAYKQINTSSIITWFEVFEL